VWKCPHGSGNDVQGFTFNLLECVSCESGDRILFVFICKLTYVLSIYCVVINFGGEIYQAVKHYGKLLQCSVIIIVKIQSFSPETVTSYCLYSDKIIFSVVFLSKFLHSMQPLL